MKKESRRVGIASIKTLCWAASLLLAATASAGADDARVAQLRAALSSPERAETDRARDAGRKPAEVVAFLGIDPGMTVVDLIAAGGYYTEVLSVAVGEPGRVYAQNSPYVLQLRDGANDKAMTARLAGARLANVERLDREVSDLGLAPGSIDAAVTALNFHDIYNGRGVEAAQAFLVNVRGLLKPGGTLGIIDHIGSAEGDNSELHRIELEKVLAAVKAAGFEVEATGDLLRNSADDHSQNVFDPSIRGNTDRFVLKLRKPA
jgi:predicted methyltransferase